MSSFVSQLRAKPLSAGSWPRPLRVAWLGLAWLALTVQFHTPAREVMTPTLDGSNFASYAYFTAHHFQYGTEVVPMAGPYGFVMYGSIYGGDLFWARAIAELLLNATLAALTLWFFRQTRGTWLRWAWLAAHVAFTPFVADLPLEWILLLGGVFLLRPQGESRPPPWRDLLVIAALALVSLVKGTQLILGVATLGVVLGGCAWRRQGRRVLLLGAGYLTALLLFWMLAGQNPVHLPAYLHGIMELGDGYTEAMAIPTPPDVFARALLLSCSLAACAGWALWHRRREAGSVAMLLLLAGHSFVQWKHGIVRSDAHALSYFNYAIVAALAIHLAGWWLPPARVGRGIAWTSGAFLLASLLLANWGPVGLFLQRWEDAPAGLLRHLAENGRHLLHLRDTRAELERSLQAARQAHLLPEVGDRVGTHSIDGFGFEQGLLLLNRLNYRPRPMGGGSFNAYTPWLMGLNRDFLRDAARRPDFYLLKPQSIDDRLIAADDGPALVEIVRRYRPMLFEHEHLLLAANDSVPADGVRLVHRASLRLGETVSVPAVSDNEMLLARLVVRPNWLGRLRAALYKLPPVFIELSDRQGRSLGQRRIVPAITASPFLFSPLLETPGDYLDLYEPGAGRVVGQFKLSAPDAGPFAPVGEVEFLAVARPVLAPADLAEMRDRLRFPFANVAPDFVTPAFRPHPTVRFLHPPAEAVWRLAGDERSFVFHYGIDPEAYERGTTNGVDFIVEIRGPSGAVRPVYKGSLKPREQPADRGDHTARVDLPVFAAGSRLVLRTDPGEHGDNAWDWAYVSRIRLHRGGSYAPGFFPGFSRVPDSADAENAAPIDLNGAAALLLHVPGKIAFNLKGGEHGLTLNFGFLPGAYTNGGQTTGADYVVELNHAGQPAREIFRRQLRPVTESADRGMQTATVSLTGIAAGDVLSVRTAPVPGGTNSWGWTYVSGLVIE